LSIFFIQAEDGIRDATVTGVQTCALPISNPAPPPASTTSKPPGTTAKPNSNPKTGPPGPTSTAKLTPSSANSGPPTPTRTARRQIGRASCREGEESDEDEAEMKREIRRDR